MSNLSSTMLSAYNYAKANGGVLTRFPGSLHQPVKWMLATQEGEFFGSSTIDALVKRGYMRYSKYVDGRRRSFPVEATVLSDEASSNE